MIPGHSEYWSREEFHGFKAARDAGVNIASFSANTAYWKVRYEDGGRTLVCYKTVQGDGSGGSGRVTRQRLGPGRPGRHGRRRARPRRAARARPTTSPRTPPRPSATTARPPATRTRRRAAASGPDMPENQLFGVMYVGDNDSAQLPARPSRPANADGEFAGDRIWRSTGLPTNATTTIGDGHRRLGVGRGPDPGAVPRAPARGRQAAEPHHRRRRDDPELAPGRGPRSAPHVPPAASPAPSTRSSTRRPAARSCSPAAPTSGPGASPTRTTPRIQQATYNVFSDMGVQP